MSESQTQTCSITILNKTYAIKCPEAEVEGLEHAAKMLNEALQNNVKKHPQLDDVQNLLLAALHIAHELHRDRKEHAHQKQQVNELVSYLEQRISQVAQR